MQFTRNRAWCCLFFGLVIASPLSAFADDAASRQVVDKAIERMWGDKFGKSKAMTSKMKGTIHLNGAPVPFTGDFSSQGSEQSRVNVSLTIDGQVISFASVVNRTQGWLKLNNDTSDMSADKLKDAKDEAHSGWVASLLPLKDKAYKLAPFGEIEVNGRKAVGVGVSREGQRSVNLFFDKETFQLVRVESVVRADDGREVTEETTYVDYKAFDGVQYATKLNIRRDRKAHVDLEVDEFKYVESLDDSVFAKP